MDMTWHDVTCKSVTGYSAASGNSFERICGAASVGDWFSQYRSCDETKEVWTFVVFIKKATCEHDNVQLWKKILSSVSSPDLYWENKIDKQKRSIGFMNWGFDISNFAHRRTFQRHELMFRASFAPTRSLRKTEQKQIKLVPRREINL